jgi:hypothetical protein
VVSWASLNTEIRLLRLLPKQTIAVVLAHGPAATILVQLALFYGFVVRTRLALGRWPEPYRPDPKELDFPVHYSVVALGGFLTVLTPLLAVLLFAAAKVLGLPRNRRLAAAVIFVVCYLGVVVLCLVDPGAFGEWFLD